MRLTRLALSIPLGVALFLLGGLIWQPPAPPCPSCAVLIHPWAGCDEAVQGGYICP